MEPIQGKDAYVQLKVGEDFLDLLCATEMSLNVSQDVVLKTTVGSGAWRRKALRGLSDWSVSVSGLSHIDNTADQISWFYVLQQQVRGTAQIVRIIFEADGDTLVLEGEVIIPVMSIGGSVTDFAIGDITLEGTGPFELSNVIPVPTGDCPEVFADTWDTVEGEFGISGPGREGLSFEGADKILMVFREADSTDPDVGTPGNREFNYDGVNISFNPGNPFNPGETVRVVWEVTPASS